MNEPAIRKRYTLQFSLVAAISALIMLSAGLATFVSYLGQKKSSSLLVTDSLIRYKDHVVLKTLYHVNVAAAAINFCNEAMESDAVQSNAPQKAIRYFKRSLSDHPQFASFRFCRHSGDTLMVKRMPDNTKSTAISQRTPDSVIKGWSHENPAWARQYPEMQTLILSEAADARTFPWYSAAVANNKLTWTDIHRFPSDGQPGITCSMPVHDTNGTLHGVISIDIALAEISDFMKKTAMPGSTALIATETGDMVSLVSPTPPAATQGPDRAGKILNLDQMNNGLIGAAMKTLNAAVLQASQTTPGVDTERLTYSFEFAQSNQNYLAVFSRFPEKCPLKWTIGIIVPQDLFLSDVRKLAAITFSTCGILILLALAFGYYISNQISTPLALLSQQMARVKDMDLKPSEPVDSRIMEVDTMARSFDNMITGLRSFQKYVPAALVRQLISLGAEARVGGEKRCLSIYFSDIADFTSVSEHMPPETLVDHLCEYLSRMSETVKAHHGTVDKYIGDAIMAFWGAPIPLETHALEACKTALENASKLEQMKAAEGGSAISAFKTRIGINTGDVIVANIGSELRMNYTVIGDHVNVASRLEGLNKIYGTDIIISESTYEMASAGIEARTLDVVSVKGRSTPIKIYELLSLKGELDPLRAATRELYETGFNAYLNANFTKAVEYFTRVLEQNPSDRPGQILLHRSQTYMDIPPPADWKGVYEHKTK